MNGNDGQAGAGGSGDVMLCFSLVASACDMDRLRESGVFADSTLIAPLEASAYDIGRFRWSGGFMGSMIAVMV